MGTNLTRRMILATAAGGTAIVAPSLAIALANPTAPVAEPDAEILALLDEWRELKAKCRISEAIAKKARTAAIATCPPEPELRVPVQKAVYMALNKPGSCMSLKSDLVAQQIKWEALRKNAFEEHNVRALNKHCDDLANNRYDIEQLIFEAPAQTAVGMAVKLIIWEQCYCSSDGTHPEIWDTIHAELAQFGVSL